MLSDKKFNPILTELFIRGRKRSMFLIFITQSYFVVRKDIKFNSTHYFITKIPNNSKSHNSSDINFKDFMNLYKKCTAKPYSFLVIDDTLALDNP